MAKFYLRMEGVNQANYVYDTFDLSTTRGGGLLLRDAPQRVVKKLAQLEPVSTGASSGLFEMVGVTDLPAAEAVRDEVKRFLRERIYRHATFVVDVVQAEAGEKFDQVRARLVTANRWEQMQSPSLAVPAYHAVPRECAVDRVRPALRYMLIEGERQRVSSSVYTRRGFGRLAKQKFFEDESGINLTRRFSVDLNELTDRSEGELDHKMAVIYLDGNGFGKLQDELCVDVESQREFDQTIRDYRRGWLTSLIEEMDRDEQWISAKDKYRLEILVWGGDETLWVVPAWKGWETLALLFDKLKDWEFRGRPLTHAAGLIFCHHNAPIFRVTELAHRLADLAKEVGRGKENAREKNLFGYEVLESFDHIGHNDLSDYRRACSPQPCEPNAEADSSSLILPGDRMTEAAESVSVLKDRDALPRRKLIALVRALLTKPETDEESAMLVAQRNELMADIAAALKGDELSDQAFGNLAACFGDERARWLHLAALWDYL